MTLSPKHIPLACSLKEKVAKEFSPEDVAVGVDPLTRDTIINFLAHSKDTDSSPLATIKRRAAKESRKPTLRPEDQAALTWICEAFDEWEEHYPLEQPLKDHIHRLLPLAIAMALKDDSFYTPGLHALHRLLDALHNGAVGWQMRLDRAGQMLEQRVQRSVEKALEWFNDDRLNIAAITQELVAANERDAARAKRMVQRLAETEEARLKTLSARRDAAKDINAGLKQYELPAAIGEFLKGPWYDSAQRVLVKYGANSREWEQMCRATQHLMESVQAPESTDDAELDRYEQILRYLPGELRRWLLSLEHDSDATDSAIGLVEYAHLRIQHGQKLQLVTIPVIALEEEAPREDASNDHSLDNEDWYAFEDEDGQLRAQLVLQLESGQHLLFTNFVGLKALDLSRRTFSQRISDGFAVQLANRETFSLCLASAVGVDSEDRLRQLLDPSYSAVEDEHQSRGEPLDHADRRTHEEDRRTHEEDRRDHSEHLSAQVEAQPDHRESPEPESTFDAEKLSQQTSEEPAAAIDGSNTADSGRAKASSEESPDLGDADELDPVLTPPRGAEIAATMDPDEPVLPPASSAPDASPTSGASTTNTEQTSEAPLQQPSQAAPTAAQHAPLAAATPSPTPAPAPAAAAPTFTPEPAAPEEAPAASVEREVDVPMGAWLGFHDGETPIMAKLAVFDPKRDNYIFVNRKGIAMRELSRSELRALMDQGLVDILETRSYFRDEVQRAREEGQ